MTVTRADNKSHFIVIKSKSSFAMLVIAEVICTESQFAIGDLINCRIDNLVRHDLCGFPMPTILATAHEIYEDLKGICCPNVLKISYMFSFHVQEGSQIGGVN